VLGPALDLVRRVRCAGAEVDVEDSNLRVTAPPGVLTDAMKQELVAQKADVLALFDEAFRLINEHGVRLIPRDGGPAVAIWRDADGRELRDALDAVGHGEAEILHLDDPDGSVPERYHQFVPEYVKRIWVSRELPATGRQRVAAAAHARRLNHFFDTYGTSPQRSRITTETVLHGMLRQSAADLQ
jgi:TubC N-terminal docking domain